MIKLNDICIQYTALVPPRRYGYQFKHTHAMVNEIGARPLATRRKSPRDPRIRQNRPAERDRRAREREREREPGAGSRSGSGSGSGSGNGSGSGSGSGRPTSPLPLGSPHPPPRPPPLVPRPSPLSARGSLVKIKTVERTIDRCASSPMRGPSASAESARRYRLLAGLSSMVRKKQEEATRIGPRIRENPCVLHTVEINILIFSLGRYAHRALLNSCRGTKSNENKEKHNRDGDAIGNSVARRIAGSSRAETRSRREREGDRTAQGSVACGYPDRSITRVGVSKQEFPTSPSGECATRRSREGPNFPKKKKK